MYYYNKYKKYSKKIKKLQNEIKMGGKYKCEPKNKFDEICIEDNNGKYKSKEKCINDCENYYIKEQLKEAGLTTETDKFYKFIKNLIRDENISVYIKGGNVIGLKVLKLIFNKFKDNDENLKKYFNLFLDLELIKDWDFSSYTQNEITPEYKKKINKLAQKYKLVSRASTFILYQTQTPILTEGKALFEISVLEEDICAYSCMELPLTTMKIKINEYNVKYVFMFAKAFLEFQNDKTKRDFDLKLIRRMIDKISVIINKCEDGFYHDLDNFDNGQMSDDLIKFINNYKSENRNLPQFFVTHLKDPFRLLYRLPEKNIPKTQKIRMFLNELYNSKFKVDWLFDYEFVKNIIEKFTKDFGKYINELYKTHGLDKVSQFVDGIKWGRIEIEYDKLLTDYGKELLNNMLGDLLKNIKKNGIPDKTSLSKLLRIMDDSK